MPLLRMTTSVAGADFGYGAGEEVEVSGERAQEFLRAGWAELVRGEAPATPEGRTAAPETPEGGAARARRVQRRSG